MNRLPQRGAQHAPQQEYKRYDGTCIKCFAADLDKFSPGISAKGKLGIRWFWLNFLVRQFFKHKFPLQRWWDVEILLHYRTISENAPIFAAEGGGLARGRFLIKSQSGILCRGKGGQEAAGFSSGK